MDTITTTKAMYSVPCYLQETHFTNRDKQTKIKKGKWHLNKRKPKVSRSSLTICIYIYIYEKVDKNYKEHRDQFNRKIYSCKFLYSH